MITKAGYFYIALVEKWGVSPAVASDILESDELSELIAADYIAKEKVRGLRMTTIAWNELSPLALQQSIHKDNYNQAVSEINQAIDNLIKDCDEQTTV